MNGDSQQLALLVDPPRRHRNPWACVDCGRLTRDEYYNVHDHVWPLDPDGGMLCVGCLEHRIGRRLVGGDFPDVPINDPRGASPRLRARLVP